MVDYIIFSALDSLKHKLPSGAIQGQNAFQKVREQLPPHSVEHLSKISNFVVQQLEVLLYFQLLRALLNLLSRFLSLVPLGL